MGVCCWRFLGAWSCPEKLFDGIMIGNQIIVVIKMNDTTLALAARLGKILESNQQSISCAESCTGGGIGYAITSTAGSSSWFKQSYVTYSNEAKMALLGVSRETLDAYGAVSRQTVEEMVSGCADAASADYAIAVSGIAGPDGGSADKPVGTVWFGFYLAGLTVTDIQVFSGDRHQVRAAAIDHALAKMLQLVAA